MSKKNMQKHFLLTLVATIFFGGLFFFGNNAIAVNQGCTNTGSDYCTGDTCTCLLGGNSCNLGAWDRDFDYSPDKPCPSGKQNCDSNGACDSSASVSCRTCSCGGYAKYSRCHYLSVSVWSGVCTSHSEYGTLVAAQTGDQAVCSCSDESGVKACNAKPSAPTLASTTTNCDKGEDCGIFSISGASRDADVDSVGMEIDTLIYKIDWNDDGIADENFSSLPALSQNFPVPNAASHVWGDANAYNVKAQACDNYGLCSDWSNAITVNVLACQVKNFTNASDCGGDNTGLKQYVTDKGVSIISGYFVPRTLRNDCSSADKCKSACDKSDPKCGGTIYNLAGGNCIECIPNCCEKATCAGQTCANNCGQDVQGIKDCRDENWKEVSPE